MDHNNFWINRLYISFDTQFPHILHQQHPNLGIWATKTPGPADPIRHLIDRFRMNSHTSGFIDLTLPWTHGRLIHSP